MSIHHVVDSVSSDVAAYSVSLDVDYSSRLAALSPSVSQLNNGWAISRRREFAAGRWAAAKAIGALCGRLDVPGRNGDRSPCWPSGVRGSISHDKEQAIALVGCSSKICRIGIDLEPVLSMSQVAEVRSTVITHKDETYLTCLEGLNRIVTVIFSAKETLFKALYPEAGHYFDFKDAELVGFDQSSLTLQLRKNIGNCFTAGDSFTIEYRVVGCRVLTWQIDFL